MSFLSIFWIIAKLLMARSGSIRRQRPCKDIKHMARVLEGDNLKQKAKVILHWLKHWPTSRWAARKMVADKKRAEEQAKMAKARCDRQAAAKRAKRAVAAKARGKGKGKGEGKGKGKDKPEPATA